MCVNVSVKMMCLYCIDNAVASIDMAQAAVLLNSRVRLS